MIIGIPKEIKENEFRVSLTPDGARLLTEAGHKVIVERGAGVGSGFPDEEYTEAGAELVDNPKDLFADADMVVKVKEPLKEEFPYLREGLVVFTFLHLASNKILTEALLRTKSTGVAYETIVTDDHRLPILAPMSEVAGRLSVQMGAHFLMKPHGGRGVLLGGVTGVTKGKVAIIGAGTVGLSALDVAVGLGADTTVLNRSEKSFPLIEEKYSGRVKVLISTPENIEEVLPKSDILVGAVHSPGAKTPILISRKLVRTMRPGSVIVDVAVDQGGIVETIRPTTHKDPTYVEEGVIHYGVANMPGAVPRTSTLALTSVTLPYILKLAALGLKGAMEDDASLMRGLNTYDGHLCNEAVAEAVKVKYTSIEELL